MIFEDGSHVLVYNTSGIPNGSKGVIIAGYSTWSVVRIGKHSLCIDNVNLRAVDAEGHG